LFSLACKNYKCVKKLKLGSGPNADEKSKRNEETDQESIIAEELKELKEKKNAWAQKRKRSVN